MKILVVGKYNPEYNRTKIILDGLRKLTNIEVKEMPFKKKKHLDLDALDRELYWCDVVYSPAFSHKYVRFIKRKTDKPLIFDPLISNYLTKVFDYESISRWSPRAYKNYLKDKLPFKSATLLISDTLAHKHYFHSTFGIPLDKIEVLPIGANVSDFSPTVKKQTDIFRVGFYGGFIPLQGVLKIIETAELLQLNSAIQFHLIGTGFQYKEIKELVKHKRLKNVIFEGWISYDDLSDHINSYDVCLGIFGETPKAKLVIPNKIYHYAAMGKPIITMKSAAISEVFKDQENIYLTSNVPIDIKNAILRLKENNKLNEKLGENAFQLIQQNMNEVKIAERFIAIVREKLL